MKIVLLARTQVEAKLYADQAGLSSRDVHTPGIHQTLHGLTLTEDDLVVEFPGFRRRRDAGKILEALKTSSSQPKSGAGPVWIRAGGKR